MATTDPLLDVSGLAMTLGGSQLLVDVTFSVGPGEVVGLVGESGSGKTLTGLSILGLTPPGARLCGGITYAGTELVTAPQAQQHLRGSQIAMIFQEPRSSLNPALPIGRQITDVMRAHLPVSRREAVGSALSLLGQVGLPDPRGSFASYPHELSGGMCQRAMIAMALSCGPKLLIADEPTTALDVTVQAQIVSLLRSIADEHQLSVLLITHNLAVVTQICDRVVTMYCGQVVNVDSTRQVVTAPAHPYTWALMSAARPRLPGDTGGLGPEAELAGQPANPADPPPGCRYHSRCPFAEPRCTATTPELTDVHPAGRTRCLRHSELSLPGATT